MKAMAKASCINNALRLILLMNVGMTVVEAWQIDLADSSYGVRAQRKPRALSEPSGLNWKRSVMRSW